MRFMVTGANGYLGRSLVRAAHARGHDVVATVRDPSRGGTAARSAVAFDLAEPSSIATALVGVDAVIHLAAIVEESQGAGGTADELNLRGTRVLLDAARRSGVGRFVFVSSQSAREQAPTQYGRGKWRVERLLERPGEVALRLGLVTGGAPRGVFGQLVRLCRKSALLPVLCPGAPIYPTHVRDVCRVLIALAEGAEPPARISWLGPREPQRFADYLREVSLHRVGRRLRLFPVPAAPVVALARLSETLPFLPRLSPERVGGLAALRRLETAQRFPVENLEMTLTPVAEALRDEGRRRRLVAEGRALCGYVLGRRAGSSIVRRYVRAVFFETDRDPLDLPVWVLRWPPTTRLIEPLPGAGARFRRRLDLAVRIVEMTPLGATRFHRYTGGSRLAAVLALAGLVFVEALALPLRALAGRRERR